MKGDIISITQFGHPFKLNGGYVDDKGDVN